MDEKENDCISLIQNEIDIKNIRMFEGMSGKLFNNTNKKYEITKQLKSLLTISNIYGITFFVTPNGLNVVNNKTMGRIPISDDNIYDNNGNIVHDNVIIYETLTPILELKLSHNENKLLVLLEGYLLVLNINISNNPLIIEKYLPCKENDIFSQVEWVSDDSHIIILTKKGFLYKTDVTNYNNTVLVNDCHTFSCSPICDKFDYIYTLNKNNEKIFFGNIAQPHQNKEIKLKKHNKEYTSEVSYIKWLDENIFCVGCIENGINMYDEEEILIVLYIYHKKSGINDYLCYYYDLVFGEIELTMIHDYIGNTIDLKNIYQIICFYISYLKDINVILFSSNLKSNISWIMLGDNYDDVANLLYNDDNNKLKEKAGSIFAITTNDLHLAEVTFGIMVLGAGFDLTMSDNINVKVKEGIRISPPVPTLIILTNEYKLLNYDMCFNIFETDEKIKPHNFMQKYLQLKTTCI